MKGIRVFIICAAVALTAGGAIAQDEVRHLHDLVGVDIGHGGFQMQERGYHYVGSTRAGDNSWDYWRESHSHRCVSVHVSGQRYRAITYAPDFDCQQAERQHGGHHVEGHQHDEDVTKDEFPTVCGVIVNGETHRYRCRAVHVYSQAGKLIRTALHYPDMTVRLVWGSGDNVELRFEGMVPQQARYSRYEGETNFQFEDKTYFFISDKDAARMELGDSW